MNKGKELLFSSLLSDGFRLGLRLEDIKARTASLEEQLQKARRRELSETRQALRPRHVGAGAERAREGLGSDELPLKMPSDGRKATFFLRRSIEMSSKPLKILIKPLKTSCFSCFPWSEALGGELPDGDVHEHSGSTSAAPRRFASAKSLWEL